MMLQVLNRFASKALVTGHLATRVSRHQAKLNVQITSCVLAEPEVAWMYLNMHCSQRVGNVVPGVVVWSCCSRLLHNIGLTSLQLVPLGRCQKKISMSMSISIVWVIYETKLSYYTKLPDSVIAYQQFNTLFKITQTVWVSWKVTCIVVNLI